MEIMRIIRGKDSLPKSWKFKERDYQGFRVLGLDVANRYLAFTVDESDCYKYYDSSSPFFESIFNERGISIASRFIDYMNSITVSMCIGTFNCSYEFYGDGSGGNVGFYGVKKYKDFSRLASVAYNVSELETVYLEDGFFEKIRHENIVSPRVEVSVNYEVDSPQTSQDFYTDTLPSFDKPRTHDIRTQAEYNGIILADVISLASRRRHSQVFWRLMETEDGRNYLVVTQRHGRTGILKQVTAPLIIDHKAFYDLANLPTAKDEVSDGLLFPWLDVRNLGVRLSYQNTKSPPK